MLNAEFSSKSRRFLKKLNSQDWNRVMGKIEKLRKNPFLKDTKRVIDRKEKTFRIRVGRYRILYVVFYDENLLFVANIDKRPRAY